MLFFSEDAALAPPPGFEALPAAPSAYYLGVQHGRYCLCDGLKRHRPLVIDFGSAYYRARGGVEYLPRAFRGVNDIGDATAGWGRDAWLLAYRGFRVTLYERNPYLHVLLQQALNEALQQAQTAAVAQRMQFRAGDACDVLGQHEAIYLDPMYPARKKSAKVGLEMQVLQDLLHSQPSDEEALLLRARQQAARVVVKRPQNAPFLALQPPHHSIDAPNTRYDVYT